MRLHYSPRFREFLHVTSYRNTDKIKSIAEDLLELEDTTVDETEMNFIDTDKDGYLSFLSKKSASKKFGACNMLDVNRLDNDYLFNVNPPQLNVYTNESRGILKIGRFINILLKSIYSNIDIENFVDVYKSIVNNKIYEFKLVSGSDIKLWYTSKSHSNLFQRGSLDNSCMVDKGYVDLYVKNPEVCQLLIMTLNGKLVSRALVWKLTNGDFFMDRIYSKCSYQDINLLNYALTQKWKSRILDSHNKMSVKIKKIDYDSFPYLDTFSNYDNVKGILCNKHLKRGFILRATGGGVSDHIYRVKVEKIWDKIISLFY